MRREGFIGEIALFSTAELPDGWLPCDGRTLEIRGNQPLFALIGTKFGGDDRTNFMLPNLSGRAPLGAGYQRNLGGEGFAMGQAVTTPATGTHVEKQKASVAIYAIATKGDWPSRD